MTMWRILLLVALVTGAILPHCAVARPTAATSCHEMRDAPTPAPTDAMQSSAARIGCATPVYVAPVGPCSAPRPLPLHVDAPAQPTMRIAGLDPPPPRAAA